MATRPEQQKSPDRSVAQRASNELVKMIRKLRWMGMETEAKELQTELTLCDVPAADSVVAESRETD